VDELSQIRYPAALAGILKRTAEVHFTMASEDRTGVLLRTLAASKPGGRFLELGTGTGVSTAWLLDGMDAGSELTSVDVDGRMQAIAQDALGADRRLKLILGDAADFLEQRPRGSFDFVFADAMPGKYEHLEAALGAVKAGGFYVIDDMLPQPNWPEDHAPKVEALMERLNGLRDFAVAPMAWASGVVLAVRVGGSVRE
jgi:predicted O-methyltransferase YrrM